MMNSEAQRAKAIAFRKLHQGGAILVLPNVWDCLSATILAQAGFPALATTSGGIASVFGYPDGQRIPRNLMLAMAGRIASVVSVPVTADLEAGYATNPEQVRETIIQAIQLGLVGANLEDGTGDPTRPLNSLEQQSEIIKAVKQAADAANIPFFINARVDVFLHGSGDKSSRLQETLRRAEAYRQAGADGIFVIGLYDRELIGEVARQTALPLNVLFGPDSPSILELQELGVARVTFGSGLLRATLPFIRDMAQELRNNGVCPPLSQTEFTHMLVNKFFHDKPAMQWCDTPKVVYKSESTELASFTPRAQQVLGLARREADKRHDNYVGTEHLLMGLIALGQGVATNVLLKQGLNLDEVRQKVEKIMGSHPEQEVAGNIPYTPRVKRILALAAKEAKALSHTYVGTEHLLLALLRDEEGVAGRVLRQCGVEITRTRLEILKELDPNFGGGT